MLEDSKTPRIILGQSIGDWFLKAIYDQGTVSSSLDAVLEELEHRRSFAESLKRNLVSPELPNSDRISDTQRKLKVFENTLRVRLGILLPEREAAWFRISGGHNSGPFSSVSLKEPVLGFYQRSEASNVRRQLIDLWTRRQAGPLPFTENGPCLWKMLLELNAELEGIRTFVEGGKTIPIDTLPDALPPILSSPSLKAFLENVRLQFTLTRQKMDYCFQELFSASERLWAWQLKKAREDKGSPNFRKSGAADDMRYEFRQRRQGAQPVRPLSLKVRNALHLFGYSDLPPSEALRSRYKELVKALHPDCPGGDEQAFKDLTSAYDLLRGKGLGRSL